MPTLLKKEALQTLEGAVECYNLAFLGVVMPTVRALRIGSSRYSPIVGLLGAAVELFAKACLIQGKGEGALKRNDGFYKYGSETLEDLRIALRDADPGLEFLWQGADDSEAHRKSLQDAVARFRMLQGLRADGLHGGRGPSKDVTRMVLSDVYQFIMLLVETRRFKAYLRGIPEPEAPTVSRTAILEDLARRLQAASELGDRANLLRAIYIVLPYIPDDAPEWLSAFDRVDIAPSEEDLSYLVNTLEDAHGIHFFKQRSAVSDEALPVAIQSTNPQALPISPQFLRREFTQIRDQFYADVGLANGRFRERGIVDLPPEDWLLDLYALGVEKAGIRSQGGKLTAQEVWPFVAAALSVPGTPCPYWFLVHECDELSHLRARLLEASMKGNAYLRRRVDEAVYGIDVIENSVQWDDHSTLAQGLYYYREKALRSRQKLVEALDRHASDRLTPGEQLRSRLSALTLPDYADGMIGDVLTWIAQYEDAEPLETRRYWARVLSEAVTSHRDREGLVAVVRSEDLNPWSTAAKKALRWSDLLEFGPTGLINQP